MERPSFTQAVQYPSVPLVVSDPGVQPVIKVSIFVQCIVCFMRISSDFYFQTALTQCYLCTCVRFLP